MKTEHRVGILFAAVGMLAVATSASAECAWVLWTKITMSSKDGEKIVDDWSPLLDFMTRELCNVAVHKDASDAGPNAGYKTTTTKDGSKMLVFSQCWPGSIDPRGPKGK